MGVAGAAPGAPERGLFGFQLESSGGGVRERDGTEAAGVGAVWAALDGGWTHATTTSTTRLIDIDPRAVRPRPLFVAPISSPRRGPDSIRLGSGGHGSRQPSARSRGDPPPLRVESRSRTLHGRFSVDLRRRSRRRSRQRSNQTGSTQSGATSSATLATGSATCQRRDFPPRSSAAPVQCQAFRMSGWADTPGTSAGTAPRWPRWGINVHSLSPHHRAIQHRLLLIALPRTLPQIRHEGHVGRFLCARE